VKGTFTSSRDLTWEGNIAANNQQLLGAGRVSLDSNLEFKFDSSLQSSWRPR
jgi:hypothetical protein